MNVDCPVGNGQHPVLMVVIAANKLADSREFYAKLFGWQMHQMTPEIVAAVAPAGPTISLRANTPDGFQGMIPFIAVGNVEETLKQVTFIAMMLKLR